MYSAWLSTCASKTKRWELHCAALQTNDLNIKQFCMCQCKLNQVASGRFWLKCANSEPGSQLSTCNKAPQDPSSQLTSYSSTMTNKNTAAKDNKQQW